MTNMSNLKYTLIALLFLTVCVKVLSQPVISDFNPKSGSIGSSVTIDGSNFSAIAESNVVYFGATKATVTLASANQLTVTVPAGARYFPISVLTNGLQAFSKQPFLVTFSGEPDIVAGTFGPKSDFTSGSQNESVTSGDLDGDGYADLIVALEGSNQIGIYRNTSTSVGTFSFTSIQTILIDFSLPRSVAVADFDGDGKLDMVVSKRSGGVSVFRNTSVVGNITFALNQNFNAGETPYFVAANDFDGDGKPDIVVANAGDNTISVLRNLSFGSGNIAFEVAANFTTGTEPRHVAVGDLDGDGKPDLVASCTAGNVISILRNTSTGPASISFATKSDFSVTQAMSVSIGDLNGNGNQDLAVVSYFPLEISLFRYNGIGPGNISYAAKTTLTAGNNPVSVDMSDLDGDGKIDLAVANQSGLSVSVFKNTNDGTNTLSFAPKVDYTTAQNPSNVHIVDLDNDGKNDLAVSTQFSILSILENNGDVTPPQITSFSPLDNNTNVSYKSNLVLTFNEFIQKGTGSIIIRENEEVKEIIDVSGENIVVEDNTVTIDAANFNLGTSVNIEFASGVFEDLAGNAFGGIADATIWNFTIQSTVPLPGIVAQYNFNGNADDGSGNGYHATVEGATLTTDRFGNGNRAYAFDGSSNYIDISGYSIGNPSVSLWFKSNDDLGRLMGYSEDPDFGYANGLQITLSGSSLGFKISETTNFNSAASSYLGVFNDDKWHHLVISDDSENVIMFLDGTAVDTLTSFSFNSFNRFLGAGRYFGYDNELQENYQYFDQFLTGSIDDVTLYSGELIPQHVTELYESGGWPLAEPFAFYPFDLEATDDSGNGLDANFVSVSNTVNRFNTTDHAFEFNGVNFYIGIPNNALFSVGTNTDFSFSGWFNTSASTGVIYDKSNGITGHLLFFPDFTESLLFYMVQSGVGEVSLYSNSTDLKDGKWHHVAILVDRDGSISMYIDGELDATISTNSTSLNPDTSEDLLIGVAGEVGNAGLNTFFNGKLDNLGFYSKLITEQQITQIYSDNGWPTSIAFDEISTSIDIVEGGSKNITVTLTNNFVGESLISLGFVNGDTIFFEKTDFADFTLTQNQDFITDVVRFTRANSQGLFNPLNESTYTSSSPALTKWSEFPSIETTSYDSTWVSAVNSNPLNMIDNVFSFRTEDAPPRQFDILFYHWTSSAQGGGFSYDRVEVPTYVSTQSATIGITGSQSFDVTVDASNLTSGVYNFDVFATDQSTGFVAKKSIALNVFSGLQLDSLALVALYNSTSGDTWTNSSNWLTGTLDTWAGVTVQEGRVTNLDLTNSGLTGTLPSEIGDLTALINLSLVFNSISGNLPAEIGQMSSLQVLNLGNNDISGLIPQEIGNATALREIYISNNAFEGAIPESIGNLTELYALQASNMQLSGSIPASLWNLTNLNNIIIINNQLSGEIPAEIGNLVDIDLIWINGNQFTGTIPASIGNLTLLRELRIENNEFSGFLPTEFSSLTNLQLLEIQANEFTRIPDLTSLTSLTTFNVNDNRLSFGDLMTNQSKITDQLTLMKSFSDDQTVIIDSGSGKLLNSQLPSENASDTYQWYFNDVVIEGANSKNYPLTGFDPVSQTGTYRLQVSNSNFPELLINSGNISVTEDLIQTLEVVGSALPGGATAVAMNELFFTTDGANASPKAPNYFQKAIYLNNGTFGFRINGINVYGDNEPDNIAEFEGTAIAVSEGFYQVEFDAADNSYTISQINTIEFLGSAITGDDNGWGNPILMDNPNPGIYTLTNVTLYDGMFKFRANGAWDINWGSNDNDGLVDLAGKNINAKQGNYNIQFNLRNDTYSVTPLLGTSLFAYYDFDGDYADKSGNNRNRIGGSSPSFVADRFGRPEKAISMNAANTDFLQYQWTLNGNQPFSTSVWVNWSGDVSGFREIFSWYNSVIGNNTYLGTSATTGEIRFGDAFGLTGVVLESNKWVHLVTVYDGSQAKLFYNNELVAESGTGLSYNFSAFFIGTQGAALSEFWDGAIDDIRIFDRAINTSEINQLYTENNWPLLANYTFEGILKDVSGNNLNATTDGFELYGTDRFGNENAAYQVSGENDILTVVKNFFANKQQTAISLWFNPNIVPASTDRHVLLYDENLQVFISQNVLQLTSASYSLSVPVTLTANNWYHFYWSFDTGEIHYSLNGSEFNGTDNSVNYTAIDGLSQGFLNLGSGAVSFGSNFNGKIDDVRIFASSITPEQGSDLYLFSTNEPEPVLVRDYPFNGDSWDYGTDGKEFLAQGASLITDRFNNVNSAFELTAEDYLISDPIALDEYTISFWTNFNDLEGEKVILSEINPTWNGVDNGAGNFMFRLNNGILDINVYDNFNSGSQFLDSNNDAQIAANEWNHLTVVVSEPKNIFRVYANGVNIHSASLGLGNPLNVNTEYALLIGRYSEQSSLSASLGKIDDIKVYKGVLSGSEILALANEPVAEIKPITGLTARQVSTNTVNLYWDQEITKSSYFVDISTDQSGYTNIETGDGSLNSVVVTINPGTTYYFRVTGYNQSQSTISEITIGTRIVDSPIVSVTPEVFSLDDEITITYYPDRSYPLDALVGESSIYFHSGLVPYGNGLGEWDPATEIGTFTDDDGVGLMTNNGDGTFSITITPRVYYGVNAQYAAEEIGMVFRSPDGQLVGKGEFESDIYLDIYSPPGTFGMNARALSTSSIRISYGLSAGAEYYYLYRSTDNVNFDLISTITDLTATTYMDESVANGTLYFYYMEAVNADGITRYNSSTQVEVEAAFNSSITSEFENTRTYTGQGLELNFDVAVDHTDGSYYVLGRFTTEVNVAGTVFTTPENTSSLILSKYTVQNELIWVQDYQCTGVAIAFGVETTNNGVILFAQFNGELNGQLASQSGAANATTILSINKNDASVQNQLVFASNDGVISGGDLAVDDNGKIYVVSNLNQGTFTHGSSTLNVGVMVLQINADFTPGYAYNARASSGFGANGIAEHNGEVYVGGYWVSNNTLETGVASLTGLGGSNADGFIIKINQLGTAVWAKNIGSTSGNDIISDLAVDPSGNVYATGWFVGDGNYDGINLTNNGQVDDIVVTKWDNAGNIFWAKNFGGAFGDFPLNMIADDKNLFVSFVKWIEPALYGDIQLGNSKGGLLNIDFNGNLKSVDEIEGSHFLRDMATGNGKLYIAGTFIPAINIGGNIIQSTDGGQDGLLLTKTLDVSSIGLVGYYTFDFGSTNDMSGNGFNGIAINNPLFSMDRFGNVASSFEPQNNGTYIEINHEGAWDLNGAITLSAWIRTNGREDTDNFNIILEGGDFGSFYVQGNELVYAFGTAYISTVNNPLVHKQWSYVTLSIDTNNTARIYINGNEQEIFYSEEPSSGAGLGKTIARPSSTSQILNIGSANVNSNFWFDGDIDDVRIYAGTSLDQELINNLYVSELPGGINRLVAQYDFTNGELVDRINNFSSNNFLDANSNVVSPFLAMGRTGDTNGAINFNNTGYFANIFHERSININQNSTVNIWINPNELPESGRFGDVVFSDGAGGRLMYNPNGSLFYHYQDVTSVFPTVFESGSSIQVGEWQMITYSIDIHKNLSVYHNGNLVISQSIADETDNSSAVFTIGSNDINIESDGERYLNAIVDDVSIYQRVLSISEVRALFDPNADGGLLAAYPFDGNANDVSGNGFGGSPSNPTLINDRFDNPLSAYRFAGSDQITINRTYGITRNLSVVGWIYRSSLNASSNGMIVGERANSGSTEAWQVALVDGNYYFSKWDPQGIENFGQSNQPVPLDQWVHFVVTYDGFSTTFYQNGTQIAQLQGNVTGDIITSTTSIPTIGGDVPHIVADLDEIKIYNRVLNPGEVLQIYNDEAPTAPLAPEITSVRGIASDAVSVSWIDNATNETEYQIKVFTYDEINGNIDEVYFVSLAPDVTNHFVFGLTPGQTHNFEVIAVNAVGFGLDNFIKTVNALQKPIVEVSPAVFTLDDVITLTYYPDRSYPEGNLVGVSPIYMYSGLLSPENINTGSWSNIVGNWGLDDGVGIMTDNGDGSWSITITPRTYYNVPAEFVAGQIGIVFRNAEGTLVGKDEFEENIYIDVFNSTLFSKPNGNYLIFDGSGYLYNSVPDSGDETAWTSLTELTIETWVYLDELLPTAGSLDIIARYNTNFSAFPYSLYLTKTEGGLDGIVLDVSNSALTTSIEINQDFTNQWVHLAGTYDGSSLKLYVNGELVNQADGVVDISTIINSDDVLVIGYPNFKGSIDETRIWNYARSRDEIVLDAQRELVGSEFGLNGYWKMDELFDDGRTYTPDATSFGNNMYFDGSIQIIQLPDIRVQLISINPSTITQGSTFDLEFTLFNNGDGILDQPFAFKVVLSDNPFYDISDTEIALIPNENQPLNPGASETFLYTLTVPELINASNYYVIISADNANEVEETIETNNISNVIQITVTEPTIGTPTILDPTEVTANQFRLNWSAVAEVTGYAYSVSRNSSFTDLVVDNISTTETSALITGLAPETQYFYRVNALKDGTSGAFAFASVTTTAVPVLAAPNLLSPTEISFNQFRMNWSSVAGSTGYVYSVSRNNTFTDLIVNSVSTTATSALITGLNPQTQYFYRVNAVQNELNSDFALGNVTTSSLPADTQAPTFSNITFTATVASATNVNVSLTANDNVGVTLVRLFVKGAGENSFSANRLATKTSESIWSAQVQQGDFNTIGATFQFEINDAAGNVTLSTINTIKIQQVTATTTVTVPPSVLKRGTSVNSYQIFASPYNQVSTNVLFADFGPHENDSKWRILTYNAGFSDWVNRPSTIAPAKGYWLLNGTDQSSISFTGVTEAPLNGPEYYVIPLAQGWNMIGNPFYQKSINWNQVMTFNVNTQGNFTNNDVSQLIVYSTQLGTGSLLKPYEGGFIYANRALTLQIPLSSLTNGREEGEFGVPRNYFNDEGGWETVMRFETDGWMSGLAGFGEMPEASNDIDAYDYPMPLSFDQGLHTRFNSNELSKDLVRDIRKNADNNVWHFDFSTHLDEGTLFTISFNGNPVVNSNEKVVLFDHKHQKLIEVSSNNQYKFTYSSGISFTVVKGNQAFIDEQLLPESIIIGDVYPNPVSNGQFNVALSLPRINEENYNVILIMNDISGRTIKTSQAVSLTEGRHELEMNLVGTNFTDGIYMLNIQISSPSGKTRSYYQRVYLKN